MEVVKTFGRCVDGLAESHPRQAQRLLKAGWQAQNQMFRFAPDKRLLPADRYLAHLMMSTMIHPLKDPATSAIVSIFTPCELVQESGLRPYNVESFSCYLSGSQAEGPFLREAEDAGISESLCSYHKTFVGAAARGILPKPACIVYTNLICDANLLTFQHLARFYDVPAFAIDVPMRQDGESVRYVADQLRDLAAFLEERTGRRIDKAHLSERVARSRRTLETLREARLERGRRCIPTDLVTPLYGSMTAQILLGTPEEERYAQMLLRDVKAAPAARGKRIHWMHTIPFWSKAVEERLAFTEAAQIVGCELGQTFDVEDHEFDPGKPFEAMAERMVYHNLNGPVSRRIEAGIRHAKEENASGAVWFCHWGCKHTLGAAQIAKRRFEEAGLPLLVLDGDGCDRRFGGEGQTSTRLGAFLEMLEA